MKLLTLRDGSQLVMGCNPGNLPPQNRLPKADEEVHSERFCEDISHLLESADGMDGNVTVRNMLTDFISKCTLISKERF